MTLSFYLILAMCAFVVCVVVALGRTAFGAGGGAECPDCRHPGVFIRTRYFETQYSHVWMCQNAKCRSHRLYFHTDHNFGASGGLQKPKDADRSPNQLARWPTRTSTHRLRREILQRIVRKI